MAKNPPPSGRQAGDKDEPEITGQAPKSALARELEAEAAANDGKTTAGVAHAASLEESKPVVPLPGTEGAGAQGSTQSATLPGLSSTAVQTNGGPVVHLPQGANPLDAAGDQKVMAVEPARSVTADKRPDAAPNQTMPREISEQEKASFFAFGKKHGLLNDDNSVKAQPGTIPPPAGAVKPVPVTVVKDAVIQRQPLPEGPGCPPKGEDGDKDRAYFVWQCRNGNLPDVIAHYAGRKIAGELITEDVIKKVRNSKGD